MERRSETIDRKDILNKIDALTVEVTRGFARNDALGEGINRRLDTLNGKVAEHERLLNEMKIKDAVQKQLLDGLQKAEDGHVEDAKKLKFMTTDKLIGAVVGLISMGLVSLITFYLTYKR